MRSLTTGCAALWRWPLFAQGTVQVQPSLATERALPCERFDLRPLLPAQALSFLGDQRHRWGLQKSAEVSIQPQGVGTLLSHPKP